MQKHKLINPSQHGFLKAKSCLTNLLCFLEEITKWVDDGSPVDVIYISNKIQMQRKRTVCCLLMWDLANTANIVMCRGCCIAFNRCLIMNVVIA